MPFALLKFLSFYTAGEANINKRIDSHEVFSTNPLFLDNTATAREPNLIFEHVGKGPGEQNGGLKKASALKGARPFQLDTEILIQIQSP
jgi:hypothetical protein